MNGHTPGPWEVVQGGVWAGENVVVYSSGLSGVHAVANARLIAAAPELLEAGNLIYEQLYGPPMTWADQVKWETAAEALKAAIAKAEGR